MDELRVPSPPIASEQKFEIVSIIKINYNNHTINFNRKQTVLLMTVFLCQMQVHQ